MLAAMNLRQHLICALEAYASAKGLSTSRVSTLVFNHGDMHSRLVEGKDITVGRLEDAVKWFDANWPDDVPWPDGLPRPSLATTSTEAA